MKIELQASGSQRNLVLTVQPRLVIMKSVSSVTKQSYSGCF